jgi:hypothetical protein
LTLETSAACTNFIYKTNMLMYTGL